MRFHDDTLHGADLSYPLNLHNWQRVYSSAVDGAFERPLYSQSLLRYGDIICRPAISAQYTEYRIIVPSNTTLMLALEGVPLRVILAHETSSSIQLNRFIPLPRLIKLALIAAGGVDDLAGDRGFEDALDEQAAEYLADILEMCIRSVPQLWCQTVVALCNQNNAIEVPVTFKRQRDFINFKKESV